MNTYHNIQINQLVWENVFLTLLNFKINTYIQRHSLKSVTDLDVRMTSVIRMTSVNDKYYIDTFIIYIFKLYI